TMEQTVYETQQMQPISYTITNAGDMQISHSSTYQLEKLVEDEWRIISKKTEAIIQHTSLLFPKQSSTHKIILDDFSYDFTKGTYRIIQPMFGGVQLAMCFIII
ncbi:MAG: hypothetical protein RSB96_04015, partial [Oscillospiraceae bacterium]